MIVKPITEEQIFYQIYSDIKKYYPNRQVTICKEYDWNPDMSIRYDFCVEGLVMNTYNDLLPFIMDVERLICKKNKNRATRKELENLVWDR